MLQVGVLQNLSIDCILERDLPVLWDLLGGKQERTEICAFVTRSQTKADLEPLPDLDRGLCEGVSKGPRKSW